MSLLIDISAIPDAISNDGLEYLHKANSEMPEGNFAPHENPFLTKLVELFHEKGITQLDVMWAELQKILHGEHTFDPSAPAGRLSQAELALLENLIQSGHTDQYGINDWMLLVEYWMQRYLPHDYAINQAYWLAAKAVFMGRMQAVMTRPPSNINAALQAAEQQPLTATAEKIKAFAQAHCTESIVSLSDTLKHKVKSAILEHYEAQSLANAPFKSNLEGLEGKLFDAFGSANKDWRKIAVTETGEIANQAYVAGQPPGTRLKRLEMYKDACPFCQKINGLIVTVVDPGQKFKDPWTQVWVGKTNIGKSSSPMKKVGDKLVPRTPEEMWWPAAGLQHPNCRGSWIPASPEPKPGDDKAFHQYLEGLWSEMNEEPERAEA